MVYWDLADGENVPAKLLEFKGVREVRVCKDAYGEPFSYHAMSSDKKEIGYMIPEVSSDVMTVDREWGAEARWDSDRIKIQL